jgi:hypothetical protein
MTRAAEPADGAAVLLDDVEDDDVVTAAVDVAEGFVSGDAESAGRSVFAIAGSGDARWISCGFAARAGVGSRRTCTCGVTAAAGAGAATARVFAGGAANSTRRISIVACTGAAALGRGRKSCFTNCVSRTAQSTNAIRRATPNLICGPPIKPSRLPNPLLTMYCHQEMLSASAARGQHGLNHRSLCGGVVRGNDHVPVRLE